MRDGVELSRPGFGEGAWELMRPGLARTGGLLWSGAKRFGLQLLLCAVPAGVVIWNALWMQVGQHPAPMFGDKVRPIFAEDRTSAIKRSDPAPVRANAPVEPKPVVPVLSRTELITQIQRELTARGFYSGPLDGAYGPRTDGAIRDFEQAAGRKSQAEPNEALLQAIAASQVKAPPAKQTNTPRRADPIADLIAPSQRTLAVQRALTDFGFGPVRATGVFGVDTKLAIEKFERERKLPVTGQISDRLLRELAAVTGRPLE